MSDRCPYLDYRDGDGERSFDAPRPYCEAAESFVQPMRADICNLRYGLDPATHCEIFIAAESEGADGDADADDAGGDPS